MKKTAAVLLFLVLIIASASLVFSAGKSVRQITGNVTAIDTGSNTITVIKKDREVVLNIEDKTKVIQCSETTVSSISIGDKVTSKYNESPDNNTAKSITIRETH
ncbi:MAG TPA: hypothetical protein ENH40_05785 [Nitrospirae bacterium]|nr:hypothetical protein [Nitrospirota bacterium]